MKFWKCSSFLLLFYLLASCVTTYGPLTYKDTKVKNNVHLVSFGSKDSGKAYIYCLFRCSEVAYLNGKKYFEVIKEKDLTTEHIGYSSTYHNSKNELRIKLKDICENEDNCFNAIEFMNLHKSNIYPSKDLIKERGEKWFLVEN